MEKLKNAINILIDVVSTMDTISVTGIDNQDKFVGCAMSVKAAAKHIADHIASEDVNAQNKEGMANG